MLDALPSFSQLVKNASPSVVYISTVKTMKSGGQMPMPFGQNDQFRDFFDRYFRDRIPKDYKQNSLGTGFIINKDGYIITNNHVVEKADEIKVTFTDKREFEAEIIGRDAKTDLALIRIKSDQDLTPLPFGDSDKLEVGDWVVAIGNPYGLGNTVTAGIVSAKYRKIGAGHYENFIQTDASINPGNSGGPLLNIKGEVVGINTAIFSQNGGSVGIGFAIPVNMAKDLLPQLKKGQVVRGWLGVMIQMITSELKDKLNLKDEKGALVADVTAGGPAENAGIQRGDVILSFDGKEIKEWNNLPYIVASTPVGKTVTVGISRKGRDMELHIKIERLEEEQESVVADRTRPDLGMTVNEITPEIARNFGLSQKSGLIVVQVQPNSPAADAGIRQGDIILEVDQTPIGDITQFNRKLDEYKTGDTILFLVKRQRTALYLTLKVLE
ncbi:MAG: DegQ family serine endoprotease [Deltaproteobacteria bacterium]|nr:DegQ family serine endoprotease [Deltaproteobacteria bacterium]